MDDAHVVEVLDGVQDLTDELAGVFFCVEALLDDAVEEFPTGHPGPSQGFKRLKAAAPKFHTELHVY